MNQDIDTTHPDQTTINDCRLMPCVCGHGQRSHHTVAMSVPLLPNPTPLYKVPAGQIANTFSPTSTYDRDECDCGCCCQYEENRNDV